jgi:hypothetical protein
MRVIFTSNNFVHALLSTSLLNLHLLKKFLVIFDFFLSILDPHLQVKEEIRRLHFLQSLFNSVMLFNEVLNCLVCVLYLLLASPDLL